MENPKGRITYAILFDCKHSRIFEDPAPKMGDLLWCPRCARNVRVESAPAEWRIRCQDCVYTRGFGRARVNAEVAAAKHRIKQPSHVVDLFDGNTKVRRFGERYQTVIPDEVAEGSQIPF